MAAKPIYPHDQFCRAAVIVEAPTPQAMVNQLLHVAHLLQQAVDSKGRVGLPSHSAIWQVGGKDNYMVVTNTAAQPMATPVSKLTKDQLLKLLG